MKETLSTIGAYVATIVVLGTPILWFVSFIYEWNGFIVTCLFAGLIVDFFFVLSALMQEAEE